MKLSQLASLLFQLTVILCLQITNVKTLVLYDESLISLNDYKPLLSSLKELELDIKSVTEPFTLFKNDVLAYDNLILFTTKSKSADLASANLLKYVEYGGNLVILSDTQFVNPSYRAFLNELGIYPSPKHTELIDHFNNLDETHKLIKLTSQNVVTKSIISSNIDLDNIKYKGSVALLNNSPLLFPVLQAPSTSYSKNTEDDELDEVNWTVGSQGYVVVSHQSLNNGRVTWFGSQEFFLHNAELSKDLISWTCGLTRVLKINWVEHSHVNGDSYESRPYKIKDEISYNISVSEFSNGMSQGYITDNLQLDVKLLDPYYRLNLKVLEEKPYETVYGTVVKLPDHHGVFSFEANYNKPGYSYLKHKDIRAIRHLANDEFARSWEITNAWVYVVSSIVVFAGWFSFIWSFIYSSGKTSVAESKKDK